MNKKIFCCALTFIAGISIATAAHPFRDMPLDKALEAAAAENKLVMVDCFTDWCVPCKVIEKDILSQQVVADYLDEKFVNIKVDMEKGEGPAIAERYKVAVYPTFLVIHPDGSILHKVMGGRNSAEGFISALSDAFDPEKALGPVETLYDSGNRDPELLAKYYKIAFGSSDLEKALEICTELAKVLPRSEWSSPEYWFLTENPIIAGYGSELFDYLLEHQEEFRSKNDPTLVDSKIYIAIAAPLLSMISREDDDTPLETAREIAAYLASHEVMKKEILQNYADLAVAYKTGDNDGVIKGLRKAVPEWIGIEVANYFPMPARKVFETGTPEQRQEIIEYTQYVRDNVRTARSRAVLDKLAEELQSKQ